MPETETNQRAESKASTGQRTATLITGAGGEIGHGLIEALSEQGRSDLVALDLKEMDADLRRRCHASHVADVRDAAALRSIFERYQVREIYHLAALLSTTAEKDPEFAHAVNVGGTMNILELAAKQGMEQDRRVRVLFPSTIAVYGLPDVETRESAGAIREDQYAEPATMYGCNKLYCEQVGRYYSEHYRRLSGTSNGGPIDFRAVRYPGIVSAHTTPNGGTSDYFPEMLHAAAKGDPYASFVAEHVRIPFMTMPDAIDALLALAGAEEGALSRRVYNVTSFNPTAGEYADRIRAAFPEAQISFRPDVGRAAIVDTWPADIDDTPARRDWGYAPQHDLAAAFDEYLIPAVRARYGG